MTRHAQIIPTGENGHVIISLDGELIYRSDGQSFQSKDKAEAYMRHLKYREKDPRFQDVYVPSKPTETPNINPKPTTPYTAMTTSNTAMSHQTPTQTDNITCNKVLDLVGRSPAETCKPQIMSIEDYKLVYKHYTEVTEHFTHDQLYLLNDLLYRYSQAWNLAEQIHKLKAQSCEYNKKTAWKYSCPAQAAATTSPTTISDEDF